MELINGPAVPGTDAEEPVLPGDLTGKPTESSELEIFEEEFRTKWPAVGVPDGAAATDLETPSIPLSTAATERRQAIREDRIAALDVLRKRVGCPSRPRYSVLRVGAKHINEVLGFLRYGIRVFLIAPSRAIEGFEPDEIKAYQESRLLEWAVIEDLPAARDYWIVDGQFPEGISAWIDLLLRKADDTGGFNRGQFDIVHARTNEDVLVTAGAGTGKTETMAERLIFLLSMSDITTTVGDEVHPADLSLDEVGLVTFTREAAREMRSRLARTIVVRQRLAPRCVLPTVAWLTQLGRANISTIHMFAKRLLQEYGSAIGITPNVSVSQQRLPFKRLLQRALSQELPDEYGNGKPDLPAIHEWESHVETIWAALENNGVPLLRMSGELPDEFQGALGWGGEAATGNDEIASRITHNAIEALRISFGLHCRELQVIPTGQLVPAALLAVRGQGKTPAKKLRFLFVDEFQDTDALQMELLLEIRTRLMARLFVVGDAKQGIYRFRGAAGNAFEELRRRTRSRGLERLQEFGLTRNFRSGGKLLSSMHPFFQVWGKSTLLAYGKSDELRADPLVVDRGVPVELREVERKGFAKSAAEVVDKWRRQHKVQTPTIAVICRRNSHAMEVQKAIRAAGGSCDILVGGSFFTCTAVREMRVILEAIINPTDDAALLELCDSRWSGALFSGSEAHFSVHDSADCWKDDLPPAASWAERFGAADGSGRFMRQDLEPLRQRILSLRGQMGRLSAMTFIVECKHRLRPELCERPGADDEVERRRYGRCLNHLVTLMDAQFGDSAVTIAGVLDWLRLQIATNHSEDEPTDAAAMQGQTTALTVHKAKGLEFDLVLVPNTWTTFEAPKYVTTRVAVWQGADGRPDLLWEWNWGEPQGKVSNRAASDSDKWRQDALETKKEEARLLYVAMTRARASAVLFMPPKVQQDSWAELLSMRRT